MVNYYGSNHNNYKIVESDWFCALLERVSIDCRKTKTKVITLANQKGWRQSSRHKARENVNAQATIGFGFTPDWLTKWRESFEPITA